MDHRVKAEGQNVPSGTEESPESEALELGYTGERFLPGTAGSAEIAYDHIARYRFAERYVKGKKIVDMGCGAGYGTYALSRFAESVLGVDLSEEAVAYDSCSYRVPNLRYEVGDVADLPYEDESFEVAVSFEVIEHLECPEALVAEAQRLLKEDGLFVVSTPDKQTYSNDRNSVNEHHLKEMYPLEFREILERHFRHVQIYRQGALAGSIITPDSEELPGEGPATLESTRFSLPEPGFDRGVPTTLYMLAVCTNGQVPEPLQGPHLILDRDRQIYEEFRDWDYMLGLSQKYQQKLVQRQVQEARRVYRERQRVMVRRQVQEMVQSQVQETIQRSRIWRLSQKVKALNTKARSVFGRR